MGSCNITDMIKKLKLRLLVVLILLEIKLGHIQISVPKSKYRCRKQSALAPDRYCSPKIKVNDSVTLFELEIYNQTVQLLKLLDWDLFSNK